MEDHPSQQDLFGAPPVESPVVRPATPPADVVRVARQLPKNVHLGTSSWSFPGWAGTVYAQVYTAAVLARFGLAAYARHPLLSAVNIDSTFYRPVTAAHLAQYAADVPDHFRFVVKAYSGLTTAPGSARGSRLPPDEHVFLDPDFARRAVIQPAIDGLGSRLGVLLFQFSPLGARYARAPHGFIQQLGSFLRDLPPLGIPSLAARSPAGPVYAVELRDATILGPEYEAMLNETGAVHCANVHSRMPKVDEQVREDPGAAWPSAPGAGAPASARRQQAGPLLVRWMLHPGEDYESAGARYAPFDRLIDPDEAQRERIAKLVLRALSAGRDAYVMAANNAEGSAPLTLFELAKSLVTRQIA